MKNTAQCPGESECDEWLAHDDEDSFEKQNGEVIAVGQCGACIRCPSRPTKPYAERIAFERLMQGVVVENADWHLRELAEPYIAGVQDAKRTLDAGMPMDFDRLDYLTWELVKFWRSEDAATIRSLLASIAQRPIVSL